MTTKYQLTKTECASSILSLGVIKFIIVKINKKKIILFFFKIISFKDIIDFDEINTKTIKHIKEISINETKLGKILISEKYPFGLIKFKDENFDFDKKLNCGSASIKVLKPEWLK